MAVLRPRMSRWRGSATSFGPVGRLAVTGLVLLPAWWLLGANIVALAWEYKIGYFFAACAWTIFVVPVVMRDTWKRVPDRSAPPELVLPAERGPLLPGESLLERETPTRW